MAETQKVEINLYDHTVKVVYYPTSHQYKVDGKNIISVSAVSGIIDKPFLLKWVSDLAFNTLNEYLNQWVVIKTPHIIEACNMYKAKQAEAKYVGTLVHDYVENYSKWLNPDVPEEHPEDAQVWQIRNGILSFLKWKTEHNVKFLVQEVFVYSKKYGYGGRFDAIIEVDGKRYLVDYKTSKSFYEMEMWMQTAWYFQAYTEESGDNLDGRMILMFNKETGDFSVHAMDNLEEDTECFNAALVLLKRKKILDAKQKQEYLASKQD